jgi:hypothetical protein
MANITLILQMVIGIALFCVQVVKKPDWVISPKILGEITQFRMQLRNCQAD